MGIVNNKEQQMPASFAEFTVELYKADKRIKKPARFSKNKVGLRFVRAEDFEPRSKGYIKNVAYAFSKAGFVAEVFETFVTRKNIITGEKYQERYDTPSFCSPSSESFWSM
jgi:hypothetical protein